MPSASRTEDPHTAAQPSRRGPRGHCSAADECILGVFDEYSLGSIEVVCQLAPAHSRAELTYVCLTCGEHSSGSTYIARVGSTAVSNARVDIVIRLGAPCPTSECSPTKTHQSENRSSAANANVRWTFASDRRP